MVEEAKDRDHVIAGWPEKQDMPAPPADVERTQAGRDVFPRFRVERHGAAGEGCERADQHVSISPRLSGAEPLDAPGQD
jgi:hypothetical protein